MSNKHQADKIKRSLIERAQIKKNYAKLKGRSNVSGEREELPKPASAALEPAHAESGDDDDDVRKNDDDDFRKNDDDSARKHNDEDSPDASTAPHPDRQTLMAKADDDEPSPERTQLPKGHRKRGPKATPFHREYEEAQQRKAEAAERRRAREESERQRQVKLEEREKFRRAMAKARTGGVNGQRKLGRESQVLLEKVKRMVGPGG